MIGQCSPGRIGGQRGGSQEGLAAVTSGKESSGKIALFDFIEEAREKGESLEDALLDAGILRLRPVLMTVGATVFALVPHGGPPGHHRATLSVDDSWGSRIQDSRAPFSLTAASAPPRGAPTLEGGSMRVPVPGALAVMAMAFTACSGAPAPQVVVAPDAGLTGLQTFRVVESQTFLGDIQPGETGPEIVNSATSRALAQQITTELQRRGYTPREMDPDVLVEYGTATREDLDPSDANYNYLWRGSEWRGWGPGNNDATAAEYATGAVVIDMVDARTGELLWRGHAPVDPSGDELVAIKRLDRTAVAILKQLPERSLALGDAATRPPSISAQGRHST